MANSSAAVWNLSYNVMLFGNIWAIFVKLITELIAVYIQHGHVQSFHVSCTHIMGNFAPPINLAFCVDCILLHKGSQIKCKVFCLIYLLFWPDQKPMLWAELNH